ncbi:MAG: hypothetical protein R6W82_11340 [bacterium]
MKRRIAAHMLFLIIPAAVVGCGREAPAPPTRPGDGLLHRPDLQSVVEGLDVVDRIRQGDRVVRAGVERGRP